MLGGKLLNPSAYLADVELHGKDVTLTVAGITREEVFMEGNKKDTKPILSFEKTPKKFILNRTNEKAMVKLYGVNAEDWIGKRVTLYPTTCKVKGEVTGCIRVRVAPAATTQEGAE